MERISIVNYKNPIRLTETRQIAFTQANIDAFGDLIRVGDTIHFFADAVYDEKQIIYTLNRGYNTKLRKTGTITAIYPNLVEVEFRNDDRGNLRKFCFQKKHLFLNELRGYENIPATSERYERVVFSHDDE